MPFPSKETCTRLAPELRSAAEARDFVRRTLHSWGCDAYRDDAQLIASELVTNSVLHAEGSAIEMSVTLARRCIRIEVHDRSSSAPSRRFAMNEDTTGRGLALVDALAARWGVDPEPDGKRVWAEVG